MSITVRKIQKEDSLAVANIIRTVMPEFGASGQGFAIHDNEVDEMFKAYTQPRCAYFVCVEDGKVVGGGGVAPSRGWGCKCVRVEEDVFPFASKR